MSETAALVQRVADALLKRGWLLATAESCTGGLVAAACTALAGSSEWFERGVVSYSNAAKAELLGVDAVLIERCGAVSADVAAAMADGARLRSRAQAAIAVTGIAGPGGATQGKPVGTVWLAVSVEGCETSATRLQLAGDRHAVREQSVERALAALLARIEAP